MTYCRPSKEGFDIVIGNPPYGAKYDNQTKRYYKNTYVTANSIRGLQKGSLDTYTGLQPAQKEWQLCLYRSNIIDFK